MSQEISSPSQSRPTPKTRAFLSGHLRPAHDDDDLLIIVMSRTPSTPRRHESAALATTPQTTRTSTSHVVQSSPHYTTTRRHSLYGTEDRIIIDPGSRIWKIGFSGEGKPRDVFYAGGMDGAVLWSLNRAAKLEDRQEEERQMQARLQSSLRAVFHE